MENKEMNKVIAEEMKGPVCCPMIHEIARTISENIDDASEYCFDNDEDMLIVELIGRLYLKGAFWEAVDMLFLVFTTIEDEQSLSLLMLLRSCDPDGDASRLFLECLICYSERCELDMVRTVIQKKLN